MLCVSLFIILQKKKRSKKEHSFDPYTLNTDKKRLKYTCYLTGFNINPTIDRIRCRTRHQADGSGHRHDKAGTLIDEERTTIRKTGRKLEKAKNKESQGKLDQEKMSENSCLKSSCRGIITSRMEGSAAFVVRSLKIWNHSIRFA